MKFKGIVNFPDVQQKRKFLACVGALSEPHEIELKPYRPRRSNNANRYYFKAVVPALMQFMEEQGQIWSKDQAHDLIARNCLGEMKARLGNRTVTVRKETHILNKEEFAAYLDRAIAWLADYGIVVPPSDQNYHQQRKSKDKAA